MTPTRSPIVLIALVALAGTASPQETKGPFTNLDKALRMMDRAHYPEAEEILTSVLKEVPKHGPAWYFLALCRRLQGKEKEAIAAIKTSVELDGKNPEALLLAAELLVKEDPENAGKYAMQACTESKGNPKTQAKSIRILWILRRYKDALGLVDKAIKANPKDEDLVTMKADLALTLRDYKQAAEAYRMLEAMRPFDHAPAVNHGSALAYLGKKDDAIKAYARGLKIRPSDNGSRKKMIALMEELGYPAEAIANERVYLKYYAGAKIPDPPRRAPGSEPPKLPDRPMGQASRPAKPKEDTGAKPAKPGGN